jgi:glycyl-tRNA synthetase
MLTMQEAILRLIRYWTDNGCVLAQPFNTEVGAGTLNPATFLRVLGPEPWSTVYVEPSVRPDDSRYGDNPNRMQTHTQLQVVLKPDPGHSQELYLGSLATIGIDTSVHDVRFVEDNWESPALGAWGLGWEVWLDGLEISQYTYFQQAGGLVLDPVSVEITYGLERILMALQRVTHFKDIAYTGGVSYGEVVGQAEREMSIYYLDQADVPAMRELFEVYEREARRLIAERLPLPAHAYVLKCSHTFNVLDARGAVGATERARAFRRMRGLAHDVAALWIARREELGHPLGVAAPADPQPAPPAASYPAAPSTLALELGFEELPADQVTSLATQLADLLETGLAENRIPHGEVRTYGAPRRIVAVVESVGPRQPDRHVRVRGPRASAAFAADGTPTPAATGFARKLGVEVTALTTEQQNDAPYVFATSEERGRPSGDVLAEVLPGLISSLSAPRTMRWSAGPNVASSRALRWIVALLGDVVVPFAYAGVGSGRETRGLRSLGGGPVAVGGADELLPTLRASQVSYDGAVRHGAILAAAQDAARSVGGSVDAGRDGSVLDEVTNMVEHVQVVLGAFDRQFLRLPGEVLTVVMKKHQRYLPVRDPSGGLLPWFVSIANGPVDADAVREGNEAVLRARYADAAFFFDRDRERPLESYREDLATLVFEERVGSMLDRSQRVRAVARAISERLSVDDHTAAVVERAAFLAKADLATSLVIELPSMAGEMGRVYALASGEPDDVAEAIFESVLPRFGDDRLPASLAGGILSLADRADALVALFAVGAKPTGSNDPYALRRAASGLVQVIGHLDIPIALSWLFRTATEQVTLPVPDAVLAELAAFVATRLEVRLTDEGHHPDLVRAVRVHVDRPAIALSVLAELEALARSATFADVSTAYRRVRRIARSPSVGTVDPDLFTEAAERALWTAFEPVEDELRRVRLGPFVDIFATLVPQVDRFFDDVLVMTENRRLRDNRLALLARITAVGADRLDWEALPDTVPALAANSTNLP